MSKHSVKYEHLKAQLKSNEDLICSELNKVSKKFEKELYSRLLGISFGTILIGLGYYWFSSSKTSFRKVKNKKNKVFERRHLRRGVYKFVLNQMPKVFEKIFKKIEGVEKIKD